MNTAFIFPGQGSQYKGMGKLLYDKLEYAKTTFHNANEILGYNIMDICFNDQGNILNQTEYTQPAIFIYSLILDYFLKENGFTPDAVAGHSLGEFSALVSAGSISFEDALYIIKIRSKSMDDIGKEIPGSMAAIFNVSIQEISKMIDELNLNIVIANINSESQIIISGETKDINKYIDYAKSNGIRKIIKLNVSGAFHSPLMKKARINLEKFINSINFYDTKIPIYQNFNPNKNFNASQIKLNVVNQIDNPVRWSETILNMKNNNIEQFIEVGPKNILTKLNKNILPESEIFDIENHQIYLMLNDKS